MIYKKVMSHPEEFDFSLDMISNATIDSPYSTSSYVGDDERISFATDPKIIKKMFEKHGDVPSFTKAGPRAKLAHDPYKTKVAIVTCGGLCPGLNDVIKGLVETLWHEYGVRNIVGIPFGYQGISSKYNHAPIQLDPDVVDDIHGVGGTILGSSRGAQDIDDMADTLERMNVSILFCIGGDGTLTGAGRIAEEFVRRNRHISVIGVPKTIDNDLNFVGRTFGFETSVYATFDIITSAHVEANGSPNGIGLVKLMGRDSGFIAAYASVANSIVNFCLIPEDPFELEGENGLFAALERRFSSGKNHAVIVVAEGAGQHLLGGGEEVKDASGNILKKDIGEFLKLKITEHFKKKNIESSVKYFDPSYLIRSVPAAGTDAIFCLALARNAVHAGMAGFTNTVVGQWGEEFSLVPIKLATAERNKIDPDSSLWQSVRMITHQDDYFKPQ